METIKTVMTTLVFLLIIVFIILVLSQQESHNWLMFGAGFGACFAILGLIAVIFGRDKPASKAKSHEDKPQPNAITDILDRFASGEDDPRGNGTGRTDKPTAGAN